MCDTFYCEFSLLLKKILKYTKHVLFKEINLLIIMYSELINILIKY
jgi:hypothetical protein